MTIEHIQPDINIVIGDLSLQIANITRENAILKATIQALRAAIQSQQINDGGKLESEPTAV